MEKIVHLLNNEKFTEGYILFMKEHFSEFEHCFITVKGKFKNETNLSNVYIIDNWKYLNKKMYKQKLELAKKIFVSGIFGIQFVLACMPSKILRKTYLHFWGGDFYYYREKGLKIKILKIVQYITILRCAGIINLIPKDYDELIKIFPNNKKHYIGAVLGPDKDANIYKKYLNVKPEVNKIVVGNSAVLGNGQLEVFKMLEKFKDENIKIVCPLSYGEPQYAKKVIDEGTRIFGDKFEALTDFLDYDEYNKFLATAEIGIFNNNRQQAMGNISILLKLRKKVYLRTDTPMWDAYRDDGITVYDIENINNMNFNQLFEIENHIALKNENAFVTRREKSIKNWKDILYD